jgi:hypothetical protein
MRIEILKDENGKDYDEFLKEDPESLFFASNKYRLLLKEVLNAEDNYFLAINYKNQIIGVLPSFLKRNELYGNVLNSLPFFGSNGGIIEHHGDQETKKALLGAFNRFAIDNNCLASTIILSPFESNKNFYETEFDYTLKDERTGQISDLPTNPFKTESDFLFFFRSSSIRRAIRKAIKSGITAQECDSTEGIQFLSDTHNANIQELNGIAKPAAFFESIRKKLEWNGDYKIYIARKEQTPIAALLLFYFNETVEYITPAVVEEYRNIQPLSLLVFRAMKDATERGFKWWNWGGTWKNQTGVYQFKKNWGAKSLPYFYFTKAYSNLSSIENLNISDLLKEYPYFFVFPFHHKEIC